MKKTVIFLTCFAVLSISLSGCTYQSKPSEYKTNNENFKQSISLLHESIDLSNPEGSENLSQFELSKETEDTILADLKEGIRLSKIVSNEYLDYIHPELNNYYRNKLIKGSQSYYDGLLAADANQISSSITKQMQGSQLLNDWLTWWNKNNDTVGDKVFGDYVIKNILQYLMYIGIINIIFAFVWKWAVVLPSAIVLTLAKFSRGILLVRAAGAFCLVSLTASVTLNAMENTNSDLLWFFYPVVGSFVLFMGFAGNSYEQRKKARINGDFTLMAQLEADAWFDVIITFGSLLLFVAMLFLPTIIENPATNWLLSVVTWAYKLPIIGFLLGMGGVVFMLNTMFYGLFMMAILFGLLYSKIHKPRVE